MKNRKMLLLALLSIALVCSLILPASAAGAAATVPLSDDHSISHSTVDSSGAAFSMPLNTPGGGVTPMVAAGWAHTVGLKSDGTVVAVGIEVDLAGWGLVLAVLPSQSILTISSTAGGSVTTPGERTLTHPAGTVVSLGTEPEAGYRFVCCTGNVGTIANVNAAQTTITMDGNYSITANFVGVEAADVGIKAGDWIKYELEVSGWPGEPYPEWLNLEFLSVEGTGAAVGVTMHMSDGTEQSATMPVDVMAGSGVAFGFSGFVIPANLTTGDSVYMTGYGNVALEGEIRRTYAGASRKVVYASFSQYITQFTYYWDKLTGVMVEESITFSGITATAKAIETNMWKAAPRIEWWLWVVVAAAIVALALVVYRLKKRRKPTAPVSPTEGT